MKAVILAGGLGTRIAEETSSRPKPMVEVGGKPILWHIMKMYSAHGVNEFVICCGYKGYMIKEYFANYFLHMSDVTFDMANKNAMQVHQQHAEPWKITLIDTGENTLTGGRLKRVSQYLDEEDFCFTYGDGVGDVDIEALVKYHRSHGKGGTMTTVQPEGRFGGVDFDTKTGEVKSFIEKPVGDGGWINAGFFVCEPKAFDYIGEGDKTIWERAPLEHIATDGELHVFKHNGFWKPMDTLRDNKQLNEMWDNKKALWKKW